MTRRMHLGAIVVGVATLVLVADTTQATLLRIDFEFTQTTTLGGFPGPKTFEGHAIYDLATLTGSGATSETYAFDSAQVTVDGTTHSAIGGFLQYLDDTPIFGGGATDGVQAHMDYSFALDGVTVTDIRVRLFSDPSTFLLSDAPFVPDPADFSTVDATLAFIGSAGSFGVGANVTTLSYALAGSVPEPGTGILLGLGVVALGLARRRRPCKP